MRTATFSLFDGPTCVYDEKITERGAYLMLSNYIHRHPNAHVRLFVGSEPGRMIYDSKAALGAAECLQ